MVSEFGTDAAMESPHEGKGTEARFGLLWRACRLCSICTAFKEILKLSRASKAYLGRRGHDHQLVPPLSLMLSELELAAKSYASGLRSFSSLIGPGQD
jgi:hypothetical protein